jgi:hypothetical protein
MVFLGLVIALGGLTGLCWNVLALIPLTGIVTLTCCTLVWADCPCNLPSSILLALGLQGGYMIGLTGREAFYSAISRIFAVPLNRS